MTGVCVVTGAAEGIGRAIARRLAGDGWRVVAVDTNAAGLSTLQPEFGSAICALVGDVADPSTSSRAGAAAAELGTVRGWVNNAGIEIDQPAHAATDAAIRRQIDVNLIGTMYGCGEAVRRMLDAGVGAIVSLSSIQAVRGFPGAFAYAATKGAINAMTRQLAAEYGPSGIRVNSVLPGAIRTAMTETDWATADDPVAARHADEDLHLAGRLGHPDEIGSVVAFLLSDAASLINGQEIIADGGATARAPQVMAGPKTVS